MRLQTGSVNLGSIRFNKIHDSLGTGCLCSGGLDVIVVVVQLDIRVCRCSGCKCNGEVRFANMLVENVVAVCAVLVESYIA